MEATVSLVDDLEVRNPSDCVIALRQRDRLLPFQLPVERTTSHERAIRTAQATGRSCGPVVRNDP
jgi:hypothetical protein